MARSLTPQLKVWPRCSDCHAPYALRRCMAMKKVRGAMTLKGEWLWSRDCNHRKADPELYDSRTDEVVNTDGERRTDADG